MKRKAGIASRPKKPEELPKKSGMLVSESSGSRRTLDGADRQTPRGERLDQRRAGGNPSEQKAAADGLLFPKGEMPRVSVAIMREHRSIDALKPAHAVFAINQLKMPITVPLCLRNRKWREDNSKSILRSQRVGHRLRLVGPEKIGDKDSHRSMSPRRVPQTAHIGRLVSGFQPGIVEQAFRGNQFYLRAVQPECPDRSA